MRVDMPQTIAQTVNVENVNVNPGSAQVAESLRHAHNVAEQKESQRKSTEIVEVNQGEKTEPVKDEDRKRKALLSRREKEENKENEKDNKEGNEEEKKGESESELLSHSTGRKIDIKV